MSRMPRRRSSAALALLVTVGFAVVVTACSPPSAPANTGPATPTAATGPKSTRYEDLVTLFTDWRAFQRPKIVNGVPDYSAAAMAAQQKALAGYQSRLGGDRRSGMAHPSAGRLPHRAGGDERPRVRSPRPPAVGHQPGVLRDHLSRRERSARARGAIRGRQRGALEPHVPAGRNGRRVRRGRCAGRARGCSRRRRRISSAMARTYGCFGARDLQQQSTDLKALAARLTADHGSAGAGCRQGASSHRRICGVARVAGCLEDRAVRCRHRELRLVPAQRDAPAVHLARPRDADGTGAGARAQLTRAGGVQECRRCLRRCPSRLPRSTRGGSAPR